MPPLETVLNLRYSFKALPLWVQTEGRWVSDQDRVSVEKGETATKGFQVYNIKSGFSMENGLSLRVSTIYLTRLTMNTSVAILLKTQQIVAYRFMNLAGILFWLLLINFERVKPKQFRFCFNSRAIFFKVFLNIRGLPERHLQSRSEKS